MKQGWKSYLLYSSMVLFIGGFAYILVETIKAKNTGFETKTLWDWMELLIIPAVLAGGATLLNRSERALERKIAEDRAKLERDLATDRQQEAALQNYFDRISELLLKEKLLTTQVAEVRDVARTRTISTMRGLDINRSRLIVQFLAEAKLITDEKSILNHAKMRGMNLQGTALAGAFLQGADLTGAFLQGADLQEANLLQANLKDADLREANLFDAKLQYATLSGANLEGAFLWRADLEKANLQKANLKSAMLPSTNLAGAHLEEANFLGANLQEANLAGTNLYKANLQEAFLEGANLAGARMPDGTKHE